MLELWRRAPQRMRGMIFVCSKPQPDAEANLAKRIETIARARAEALKRSLTAWRKIRWRLGSARSAEVVTEVRAQMTLTAEAVVAVQAGLAARPDSVPTVATIHVPVLAIAGAEDATVTAADMEAFRAAPGGCEFHVLPCAGHFAAYESRRRWPRLWRRGYGSSHEAGTKPPHRRRVSMRTPAGREGARERATVVGWSGGGGVLIEFARSRSRLREIYE